MEWCCGIVVAVAVIGVIVVFVQHQYQLHALFRRIEQKKQELGTKVQLWFMIQPCFRCHEFTMKLLEISPNGRSVHYQCLHCKKKMHAPAGTPDAPRTIEVWSELYGLVDEYNGKVGQFKQDKKSGRIEVGVVFDAPAAPLPYEQTTRTPIPEAIRSEVWRRDGGRCVQCGSKQNLQFDHIIPVSKGGATSVANLQLLCQPCNTSKGKKI
jgi:HNH endonuclease